MIVSIVNNKGGVGKTTISVNVARCLTMKGKKTLLIDSAASGSASVWHEQSNGELMDMTTLCKTTFSKDIAKYVDNYEWIIIDGVPSPSLATLDTTWIITLSAIKCSDVVLIPVTPSLYDLWETQKVVEMVKERQEITEGRLKSAFIVSRKIKNTKIGKEIIAELNKMQLPIFSNSTTHLIAYATCIKDGLTVVDKEYTDSTAYKEINLITQELEDFSNGIYK